MKYEIAVLDASNRRKNRITGTKIFSRTCSSTGHSNYLSLDILNKSNLHLLPNDNLTVYCELTIIDAKMLKEREVKMENLSISKLQEDIRLAYSNKEFPDMKIKCQGRLFECHQFMLSARSPVFKAMFLSDMSEKANREVEIKDVEPDTLSELLTFMYTGKSPNDEDIILPLFKAADKYQMDILKNVCVMKLCSNINIQNCVEFLVIGDIYHAQFLKKFSLKYIANNVGELCKSNDWKKILLNHPMLMTDVIEAFGKSQKEMKD